MNAIKSLRDRGKRKKESEDLGYPESSDEATHIYFVFCIIDLLLQTHPLSSGHTYHHPTFLIGLPDGFLSHLVSCKPVQ